MDTKDVRTEITMEIEQLEERIAPGGLATAAEASGRTVPPADAAAGLATADDASGMTVPPAAAQ